MGRLTTNEFVKSHGLGNDYIVLDAAQLSFASPGAIRTICDYHFGIGSDGILLVVPGANADFGVRIAGNSATTGAEGDK